MSVRASEAVRAHSQATLAARLVMLELADAAGQDGVTWIGQKLIAARTRIAEPYVRDCLRQLEEAGEVETRKAQRGRTRINVYRLRLPGLEEPDYDRLPFTLSTPFSSDDSPPSTTAEILRPSAPRRPQKSRATTADISANRAFSPLMENRKGTVTLSTALAVPESAPEEVQRARVARRAFAHACQVSESDARLDAYLPAILADANVEAVPAALLDRYLCACADALREKWKDGDVNPKTLARELPKAHALVEKHLQQEALFAEWRSKREHAPKPKPPLMLVMPCDDCGEHQAEFLPDGITCLNCHPERRPA